MDAKQAITVETEISGIGYFWSIMLLMVLTGATTSFFQNSVFSEASQLPPMYMQAVLSGQGIAGVVVAVSAIMSAFAGSATDESSEDISRSAFLYFLSAFIITLAALMGRLVVVRLSFYRHQMSHVQAEMAVNEETAFEPSSQEPVSLISTLCKIRGFVFTVGYIFIITLMLFPTITSLIKSLRRHDPNRTRFFDDDVFVAFHFLLFNVGDWVGRLMPLSKYFVIVNVNQLAFLSVLRTAFIPLFLICNVIVSDQRYLPVLIQSDIVYMVLVWIFAVTNGWICSLAMMAAPQLDSIKTSKEKSAVGSILSFSLVLGLAIGGCLSFLARWMV
ncbi:equilibrative nucleoside transporter [Gilbertella persicaria]|uniref:equilibrative nucleoside transporter n=1 Tax=Gilbertella persicaria TaxID=101096 RepID=UPI002220A3BD|nr:equilibrative nucleoside transporter [Gilbertella persicaria]KAI8084133.1 equilibrative nucleoside transporter [Gilbertella persicaria]